MYTLTCVAKSLATRRRGRLRARYRAICGGDVEKKVECVCCVVMMDDSICAKCINCLGCVGLADVQMIERGIWMGKVFPFYTKNVSTHLRKLLRNSRFSKFM